MQHDYNIGSTDAVSGLQFRQDLNACLSAIKSSNSGATEPVDPIGGMVWFDTSVSPAVLKHRNQANTEWINVGLEDIAGLPVVASATTQIGAQGQGNTLHITGTATISSFGTSVTGTTRTLIFDAGATITNNNTSLICPSNSDMVLSAGSIITVECEDGALGYWRVINYIPFDISYTEFMYLNGVTSNIQTQLDGKLTSATGVVKTSDTGAATIPAGVTSERPSTPDVGGLRYNTELSTLEVWSGVEWTGDQRAIAMDDALGILYEGLL